MKKTLSITFLSLLYGLINAQTAIYPYRVEPAKFPDYNRRSFLAPTPSESFQDTVRFVGERYVKPLRANLFYGNFYRPNQGWIHNQSYFDFYADILSMIKEKVGVFDPAGYGPGSPYSGSFGQKSIPSNKMDLLKKLGPYFIGNSLGEQDGRYWADQRQLMEPYSRNAKVQHTIFADYMRQNAKDYGYKLTQLTTFWGNHYMPKDGYISAVGTECQNKDRVAQMQVQYAFNRGASRQYGLLNFGDVSVFDTWGHKGNPSAPYGGSSYSMMRRMMVFQFQSNAWILGFEGGWGTVAKPEPIGKIQMGMYNLVNKQLPQPGNIHAPVAFLTDFFSGWMPPYQNTYLKWGFLPYDRGQYLTHQLFNLVYPNYQNNGQNTDETPAIVANEHGDVDAILSDIQKELLLQYPMVILADELFTDISEMKAKLDYYVQNGGNLVLTAANAKKLFPTASFSNYSTIASGASFVYKSSTVTESYAFNICTANIASSQTIATVNGSPAVIELAKGKGKYTILLADYGLSNATGTPTILKQTGLVIADKMDQLMLFTAGNKLTCTTNTLNDTTYIVGIYNNSLTQQSLNIQSKIGTIKSMSEFSIGDDLSQELGYKPTGGTVVFGANSASTIRALEVRMFKIIIQNPATQQLAEVSYPALPVNKYLAIDNLIYVKNSISAFPHFFYHFSGIKIDWKTMGDAENNAFKENVAWMNHQKLDLVIDFCETFPTADFRPENVIEYNSLTQKLANIKANLLLFNGKKTIVLPEPANQLEYTALVELNTICKTTGANVLTKSKKAEAGNACVYDGSAASIDLAGLVYIEPKDTAINMKKLNGIYSNTPIVYNSGSNNWDSIYSIIDAIDKEGKILISKNPIVIERKLMVQPSNMNKYASFHNIQSIKSEIIKHQDDFFGYFGGVKVDGTYLWNQSIEACTEEARWLKTHNVKVVVDLIRELNHFPNLTWIKELESYGRGKLIMDNILLKMEILGCKNIIIGSHMRCESWPSTSTTNSSSMSAGIKVFVDAAIAKGITVHFQHREYQNYPQKLLATPAETMSLVNQFTGTKFAANLGLISDPVYLTGVADSKLGLVILAYKGDVSLDCRNPLYKGMYNKTKPDYSSIANLTIPMILDAEYSSWEELILDCTQLGWKKINL
jgi:hypothetical protein